MAALNRNLFIILILGFILWGTGCEDVVVEPPQPEYVSISGTVTLHDGTPVPGATVKADNPVFGSVETTTDGQGNYSLSVQVEADTITTQYVITASEPLYGEATVSVQLVPQKNIVQNFKIGPTEDQLSGDGVSIVVVDVSHTSIGIKESGFNESSSITFEVRDDMGRPVSINKAVDVSFIVHQGPGGGETVAPGSAKTDAAGRVVATVTSGFRAGVVQVLAQFSVEGETVKSNPVVITIHGGLPDQSHFSIGIERLNSPILFIVNARLGVISVAGDKYSNPVRPGTPIYFRTTAGVVQTEVLTDNDGVANVQLISLGKNFSDPVYGGGFGWVVAETRGEEGVLISDSARVLLSGAPIISSDPAFFTILQGTSRTFIITVQDVNGNPMAEGQTVIAELLLPELEGDDPMISLSPDDGYVLPDTQSKAFTQFTFNLTNFDDREFGFSVRFRTAGPNGSAEVTVSGTAVPAP